MFINPTIALNEGWITFPEWMSEAQRTKCIQPNAIDFTLDSLSELELMGSASITEDVRIMRRTVPVSLRGNQWLLKPGAVYDGASDFYVRVPEDVAAMLIIRSSFNRVGVHLQSGLYDAGYEGHIGFTLHNRSGDVVTEPHTRVGQIIFVHSDAAGKYAGGYNHAPGTHWQAKTVN